MQHFVGVRCINNSHAIHNSCEHQVLVVAASTNDDIQHFTPWKEASGRHKVIHSKVVERLHFLLVHNIRFVEVLVNLCEISQSQVAPPAYDEWRAEIIMTGEETEDCFERGYEILSEEQVTIGIGIEICVIEIVSSEVHVLQVRRVIRVDPGNWVQVPAMV